MICLPVLFRVTQGWGLLEYTLQQVRDHQSIMSKTHNQTAIHTFIHTTHELQKNMKTSLQNTAN